MSRFANVLKGLGRRARRPRRDLHADDPRAARGHAGLHPHRCRPLGASSAASRPTRSSTGSTTRSARSSSPPTAATAAARRPRLKAATSTRPCRLTPSVDAVVVVHRTEQDVTWVDGRDHWYHDLMADASADCPPEHMDSEDLLYLLYTSGTTAKPKGIMHTTGGYLTQVAFTHKYVFDLHPERDIYWCAADIGWVTGHSYIVYGPLTNGATSVIYEGTPDTPGPRPPLVDRRALRRDPALHRADGDPHVHEVGRHRARVATTCRRCACSARWASPSTPRRGCGTTNTSAASRCPIVDTWWQTETGGAHDHAAARGVSPPSRVRRRFPLPGISVEVVDDHGEPDRHAAAATSRSPSRGRRCCAASGATPSATSRPTGHAIAGRYFAGDGCKIDDDGYFWLLGRVDDVMNVSGHRVSTTEVESALVDHPAVAEAAVVGATDAAHRPGHHRLRDRPRQRRRRPPS